MDKSVLKNRKVFYNEDTLMYTVKTDTGDIFNISPERFEKMSAEYDRQKKNKKVAGRLCLFLGFLGVHRYYVGDYLKGFLLLGTYGGFLFGWLLDYLFIQARVDELNRDLLTSLLAKAIEDTQANKTKHTNINDSVYDARKEMDED